MKCIYISALQFEIHAKPLTIERVVLHLKHETRGRGEGGFIGVRPPNVVL